MMKIYAKDVTATILAFNSDRLLQELASSLRAQTVKPANIIVVDNGSIHRADIEQAVAVLRSSLSNVVHIRLSNNIGVGAGHNVAVQRALNQYSPSWVWILEHDCIPKSDCLERLCDANIDVSEGPQIGAVVPTLYRDETEFDLVSSRFPNYVVERNVNFTFNGVLLSAEAWRNVGVLNEDFFVGGEDHEYCRRLESAGYAQISCSNAFLSHRNKGNTRHKVYPSPSRHYYSVRSVSLRRTDLNLGVTRLLMHNAAGLFRDAARPRRVRRMSARISGLVDGLLGRVGRRSYWFLD